MRRFRLGTLMLLIVIAALSLALVVQHHRSARREAELQARLAQSWPLFLKQQGEDVQMRRIVEAMQRRHSAELAKRSVAEAREQEREDAAMNRDIEAMQQRFREEQANRELAKSGGGEARRRPK